MCLLFLNFKLYVLFGFVSFIFFLKTAACRLSLDSKCYPQKLFIIIIIIIVIIIIIIIDIIIINKLEG